jgi:DNA-binding transcriptional LysR family regulator
LRIAVERDERVQHRRGRGVVAGRFGERVIRPAKEKQRFAGKRLHGHAIGRQREHIAVTDLAAETFVCFTAGWGIRRLTDRAFEDAGLNPASPYEVCDYATAAGLVRHRLGTTLLPATEAVQFSDLCAIPLAPALVWNLLLATPPPQQLSAAAHAMTQALLQHARQTNETP